ncbi:MAG: hypothetical protein CMA92_03110 [Euryarchaeota archaeon]|nr:hypothetical protein [Euryarchaeota archaeon]|tara:strand:- start:1439 stop:2257 length:819 start_codon:yes stop_codon:yes gene_type:complete
MHRRVRVPARVNIIGEHTDYADGLALPFAVDFYLELTAKRTDSDYLGDETVIELWRCAGGWPAEIKIQSDIPIGKGMSSSAALCLAIVLAVNDSIDELSACKEAQRIEHEILKTPCGLLDQMAMIYGKLNHASLIDFSQLSVKSIPMPKDWKFKLVDSGINRKLSETEYDQSNQENFVQQENERVKKALTASPKELGKLLNRTHEYLTMIGVSTPEVDTLVEQLQNTGGVLGARMMGGGFGGMILVLVDSDSVLPNLPLVNSSNGPTVEEIL